MYKLFSILLLLALTFGLFAQESPFGFGVKAGFNISNTSFDKDDYYGCKTKEPKPGFHIGIVGDYSFSKAFAVETGLMYTTKGVKAKGFERCEPSGEIYWEHRFNLGYLQVPLLARYTLRLTDNFNFFLNAGPYFAYGAEGKVTSKYRYYNLGNKPDEKEKTDAFGDDALKKFDWGLTGGIGAEVNKIFVVFNYEYGLTNITNEGYILLNDTPFKNRHASFSFGYRF